MKKISSFKNKNVYIFGGSTGIGLELANQMAAEGAHIIIFARTESKLKKAVSTITECRSSNAVRVSYRQVDVSDKKSVEKAIRESQKSFGTPDILINCAGRAYPQYFQDITHEQFDETMKINMYGIWNTCAAALPYMEEKGGWILNTSSMVGFIGVYGYTDYAASKFAILGFSDALRMEVEQLGIGVSVLCPPDTDTPGFEIENRTKPAETMAISESAKIMTPEKVAKITIKEFKKGKKMIIPGFDGKLSYFIKRHFPFIVDFVMKQSIKKSRKN